MNRKCIAALLGLLLVVPALQAEAGIEPVTPTAANTPAGSGGKLDAKTFVERADKAVEAMRQRAAELKIQGVGVVAYFEGEQAVTWTSKMTVVGKLKNPASANDPGVNLLAIAYSKAAEMADTLKDSGSGTRPPLKGEYGWQGGLIAKTDLGYVLAAFSGASSDDDLKVARTALDLLAGTSH
jgi:hypothetical protein